MLKKGRYILAETACVDIAHHILKKPAALEVMVRITKSKEQKNADGVSAEICLRKTLKKKS